MFSLTASIYRLFSSDPPTRCLDRESTCRNPGSTHSTQRRAPATVATEIYYDQNAAGPSLDPEFEDPVVEERENQANLRVLGRTAFIATVYASTDTGTESSETTFLLPREKTMSHQTMAPFVTPGKNTVERVKDSGFRYIVEFGVPALQCVFMLLLKTLVVG
jgi:hypothetical protein